eukprot:6445415-Pyramimonas_sp.AAC.1
MKYPRQVNIFRRGPQVDPHSAKTATGRPFSTYFSTAHTTIVPVFPAPPKGIQVSCRTACFHGALIQATHRAIVSGWADGDTLGTRACEAGRT